MAAMNRAITLRRLPTKRVQPDGDIKDAAPRFPRHPGLQTYYCLALILLSSRLGTANLHGFANILCVRACVCQCMCVCVRVRVCARACVCVCTVLRVSVCQCL